MQLRSRWLPGILAIVAAACSPDGKDSVHSTVVPRQAFVDATEASGIQFRHFNGRNGEFYYPEIIGSGVALLDYNNDGKLDVLVLQGAPLGLRRSADAPKDPCTARLYRNDLVVNPDGTRSLKFLDVTEASGLCSRG